MRSNFAMVSRRRLSRESIPYAPSGRLPAGESEDAIENAPGGAAHAELPPHLTPPRKGEGNATPRKLSSSGLSRGYIGQRGGGSMDPRHEAEDDIPRRDDVGKWGAWFLTNVMPTEVGTHDKFQRDRSCCWFRMRAHLSCCALP